MPFHTQAAMVDNNNASVLHFIKTGYRIPGTRLLRDLRTDRFDMDLLNKVTQSTAPWIEYDHLAVQTDAPLHVLPDESVKLVLRYQHDVLACTSTLRRTASNSVKVYDRPQKLLLPSAADHTP
ncbi:TPA: hypothetical protein ACH3X1_002706 [Trebouxia sp. C0004]